jgi:hypothetical protein
MNAQTACLRDLDVQLEGKVELLRNAARTFPSLTPTERERLRERVLAFLREDVAEHITIDTGVLYPTIAERLGDPLAAAPLHYDHRAIRWWIDRIRHADLDDVAELQELLYGLYAVIKLHVSREQDLYVEVLESRAWPAA